MVAQTLETALGIFALWLAWQVADVFVEFSQPWVWWVILAVAGVGYQCAFLNLSFWWMGLGVGGAAVFLGLLTDLMLVASDAAKVHVLRNSRGT
jgi:hypothetical protein